MLVFTKKGLIIHQEKIIVVPELRDSWNWSDLHKTRLIYKCALQFSEKASKAEGYILSAFSETDRHNHFKDFGAIICENEFLSEAE